MTLLIDTHCWLWWLTETEKLQEAAIALLKNPDTTILLSSVSSWEIAIKYSIGKLSLPEPPERFIPSRMERDGIVSLPIQHSHTLKTATLPYYHKDPFDRLLIAQAIVEGIPIMTVDESFRQYDVEVVAG
jgi:PIN domain nuclease of toxin-antitoxin system